MVRPTKYSLCQKNPSIKWLSSFLYEQLKFFHIFCIQFCINNRCNTNNICQTGMFSQVLFFCYYLRASTSSNVLVSHNLHMYNVYMNAIVCIIFMLTFLLINLCLMSIPNTYKNIIIQFVLFGNKYIVCPIYWLTNNTNQIIVFLCIWNGD